MIPHIQSGSLAVQKAGLDASIIEDGLALDSSMALWASAAAALHSPIVRLTLARNP